MLDHFTDLVIVTGCQRSGTTLLGQVLGAHPNAFLIDETDKFYEWFHACARGGSEVNSLWHPMIGRARKKYNGNSEKFHNKKSGKYYKFRDSVTHLVLQAPNLVYSYDIIKNIVFKCICSRIEFCNSFIVEIITTTHPYIIMRTKRINVICCKSIF